MHQMPAAAGIGQRAARKTTKASMAIWAGMEEGPELAVGMSPRPDGGLSRRRTGDRHNR